MKYLVLAILFSCTAQAAENWFAVGKPEAKTSYTNKAKCELKENAECFDITGKGDVRRWRIEGGQLVPDAQGIAAVESEAWARADAARARQSLLDEVKTGCLTATGLLKKICELEYQ